MDPDGRILLQRLGAGAHRPRQERAWALAGWEGKNPEGRPSRLGCGVEVECARPAGCEHALRAHAPALGQQEPTELQPLCPCTALCYWERRSGRWSEGDSLAVTSE